MIQGCQNGQGKQLPTPVGDQKERLPPVKSWVEEGISGLLFSPLPDKLHLPLPPTRMIRANLSLQSLRNQPLSIQLNHAVSMSSPAVGATPLAARLQACRLYEMRWSLLETVNIVLFLRTLLGTNVTRFTA